MTSTQRPASALAILGRFLEGNSTVTGLVGARASMVLSGVNPSIRYALVSGIGDVGPGGVTFVRLQVEYWSNSEAGVDSGSLDVAGALLRGLPGTYPEGVVSGVSVDSPFPNNDLATNRLCRVVQVRMLVSPLLSE